MLLESVDKIAQIVLGSNQIKGLRRMRCIQRNRSYVDVSEQMVSKKMLSEPRERMSEM